MAEEDNFDIDIYGDLEESKPNAENSLKGPDEHGDHEKGTMHQSQSEDPVGIKQEYRTDPLATTALYVADLHWWTTEDELRGWIKSAGSEDQLKEITFNEHKVNGKSKG